MKLLFENWRQYLNEESQTYQIYCDMDGVLVNFMDGVVQYITNKLQSGEAEELKAELGRDYIESEEIDSNRSVRKFMYREFNGNL